MKNYFIGILTLLFIGCSNTGSKDTPQMPGTYFMESQTVNDGKSEKTYKDLKQLKIYTEKLFMYVQVNPVDSLSIFGVGFYTTDTGRVNENSFYRAIDTAITETQLPFQLNVTKTTDGYEQVIPQIITDTAKFSLTEIYKKVGKPLDTKLNGIWKESKSLSIHGTDTAIVHRTQYKAFNDGYFMFGHVVTENNKRHTGIGFGTFDMVNENQIRETDLNSTYNIIAGHSYTIDLQWDGNDKFVQTITNADGSKGIEYYDRLKK